ncbi:hypothetical protein WBP06_26170 [Novosphingobium sp. BL-8H]|uniref:hypothetical protein n=1 Tax=Novosphingobium sp. BL-8H TaxID=3127640 RepID=UPI0037581739
MTEAAAERPQDSRRTLAEVASLAWKLADALAGELEQAPPSRTQAGQAMLRFAGRRLDTLLAQGDLRLVTFDGQDWGAQIPANPINPDEVEGCETVAVDRTVEPTILCGTDVVLPGRILLRKA